MNPKTLATRIHQELDDMDFPVRVDERVDAFAKLLKIPRFQAESILNGHQVPDSVLLTHIAEELEVNLTALCDPDETQH